MFVQLPLWTRHWAHWWRQSSLQDQNYFWPLNLQSDEEQRHCIKSTAQGILWEEKNRSRRHVNYLQTHLIIIIINKHIIKLIVNSISYRRSERLGVRTTSGNCWSQGRIPSSVPFSSASCLKAPSALLLPNVCPEAPDASLRLNTALWYLSLQSGPHHGLYHKWPLAPQSSA